MSTGTILLIAIPAVLVLAALFLVVTARNSDRNAATGLLARETEKRDRARRKEQRADDEAPPAAGRTLERSTALAQRGGSSVAVLDKTTELDILRPPMDEEQLGQTRRQFFNRSIIVMFLLSLGGFGGACLAFLWPSLSGGFGAKVRAGKATEILDAIKSKAEPYYVAEARTYLVPFPKESLKAAEGLYGGPTYKGMEQGWVALYQKCVHLGCKVPWCGSSQWFECPCHGSQYNRVGEKKAGPAPRGLDRFAVTVDNGIVVVDSGALTNGPAIGADSTGQQAEGPHCTGGGGGGH
jgi:cytochrome b6-f complex iron-sulfur subunit